MKRQEMLIGRSTFKRCIICFSAIVCLFSALLLFNYSTTRDLTMEYAEESQRVLSIQLCNNIAYALKSVEQTTLSASSVTSRYAALLFQTAQELTDKNIYQRMTAALEEHISEKPYISFAMVEEEKTKSAFFRTRNKTDDELLQQQIRSAINANRDVAWYPGGRAIWTACQTPGYMVLLRTVFDDNHMIFVGTVAIGLECSVLDSVFSSLAGTDSGNYALLDMHLQQLYTTSSTEEAFKCENQSIVANDGWKVTCYDVSISGLQLVHFVNLNAQNERYLTLMRRVILLLVVTILLVVFFFSITYFRTARSSILILQQIDHIAHGQFDFHPDQSLKDKDMQEISRCLEHMASHVSTLIKNIHIKDDALNQSEQLLMKTKYDLLRSQVNPHFLYNALETIHSIAILHEEKEIGEMVYRLGTYFRASLMSQSEFYTLEQELSMLKNYICLYGEIYPDRLRVAYQIDPSLLQIQIPSLLLQPIVENALVHGMENKVGQCLIKIEIIKKGDMVYATIEDDGNGISAKRMMQLMKDDISPSGRVGLLNVRKRLRIVYGERARLNIDSEEGKYTRVTVSFPLKPIQLDESI